MRTEFKSKSTSISATADKALSIKSKTSTSKKMQRLLALVLMTVMLFGMLPTANALRYDQIPECPDFAEIVWSSTGVPEDGFTGNVGYAEGKDGKCLSIGGTSYYLQMDKNFNEEEQKMPFFQDNTAMYSFDICPVTSNHSSIIGVNNNSLLFVSGQGFFCAVDNGWPGETYTCGDVYEYQPNTWYNIKIILDGNNKRLIYYINDEFWYCESHKSSGFLNQRVDPDLTVNNLFFTYSGQCFIDGKQQRSDGSGQFLIDNVKWGMPKYSKASVEAGTDEIGNILVQGENYVNVDVINGEDADKEFIVEYEIRDSKNYTHLKESKIVTLKAGEKQRIKVEGNLEKCEFYYIKARIAEANSPDKTLDTITVRFSVVAKTETNPRYGFSVHPMVHGHGTMEEVIDVTGKLGAGVNREDYPWGWLSPDGIKKSPNFDKNAATFNKFWDMSAENNMETLMILGPSGYMAGAQWPLSAESIKNTDVIELWKNHCREMATVMDKGDKAVFEVINEWSVQEALYGTGATADEYAVVLKAAAEALREVNPDCTIVGLCGGWTTEEDSGWCERVLKALGSNPGQYFDAISVHPYIYWREYYAEIDMQNDMDAFMEMLERYGVADKPIYATEYGSTVTNTSFNIDDARQGAYMLRQFMIMNPIVEKHYFYTITRKRGSIGGEGGFGITHKPTQEEIPFEAYPGALQYAGYNKVMNGAEYVSRKIFDYGDDDIKNDLYTYIFNLPNGKQAMGVWNVDSTSTVSLDIGAQNVTVYDSYGNEKQLSATDGYITLDVGMTPIYVVGNGITEAKLKDTPMFEFNRSITSMMNNFGEVKLKNNSGKDLSIEVLPSTNITATEDSCTDIGAGKASSVVFKTGVDREKIEEYASYSEVDGSYDGLRILLKDGDKVVFDEEVKVKYNDTIDTNLSIIPYRDGIWQAALTVKNSNRVAATDGTLQIYDISGKEEELLWEKSIDGLAPGEKKLFRYVIPEELGLNAIKLKSKVLTAEGLEFERECENKLLIITKAEKTPTIDGKMDVGEWKVFSAPFKMNTRDLAANLNGWGGVDDLSGDLYLMYDENYLYFGAKIKDNIHCGHDEQDRIWAMDSIQFAVTDRVLQDAQITEIGMGLTDNGPQIKRYLSQHTKEEGFDIDKFEDVEFDVSRNGNITTYEFKISWEDLFAYGYVPDKEIIFSVLVNDNDGEGRRGWMEYGGGIGYTKNVYEFNVIPLMQ